MKILVVDNTPLMLISMQRILERNGHVVLTANSGEEALKTLGNNIFIDLIITDLMMPNLNGIELYHRVQEIDRFNDKGPASASPPPMILMTGQPLCRPNGDLPVEFGTLHSLFQAIIEKPIVEEDVISAIRMTEASLDFEIPHRAEFQSLLQFAMTDLHRIRKPEELVQLAEKVHEQLEPFRRFSALPDSV